MTLEIIQWNTNYEISVNMPNASGMSTWTMRIVSQLSNLPAPGISLPSIPLSLTTTNSRYTTFGFNLTSIAGALHGNGMYDYIIYENGGEWDTGSLKLVFSPGGGTGTDPYLSNNENREAIVYYDPVY